MYKVISLELKGITRQYKESLHLSMKELLIFLIVFFSFTLFIYILKIFSTPFNLISNVLVILSMLIAISLNKDTFYEYIKKDRHIHTNLFPVNHKRLLLIKGLKYEYLTALECLLLFIPIYFAMCLVGYSIWKALASICYMPILYLIINNLGSIFRVIKLNFKNSFYSTIFNSIYICGFFFISSIILGFTEVIVDKMYGSQGKKLINLDAFDNNILITTDLLVSKWSLFLLILLPLVYKLKITIYQASIQKSTSSMFIDKVAKRIEALTKNSSPVIKKEIRLLFYNDIFNKFLTRYMSYLLASLFLFCLNLTTVNIHIPYSLIYLILLGESFKVAELLSKNYIGQEKDYIKHYILSDFHIVNVLLGKIKVTTTLSLIYVISICMSLCISFKIDIITSVFMEVLVICNVVIFNVMINYFNSSKTSFQNDLSIPHKYSTYKVIVLFSILMYINLGTVILSEALLDGMTKWFVNLIVIIPICIVTLLAFYFLARKRGEVFYGEFAISVYKKRR